MVEKMTSEQAYAKARHRIAEAEKTKASGLDLSDMGLTALPPEIGRLTNLKELDLSGNRLSALPSEIGQLTNLTMLYLFSNRLSALPPEIGRLTNLKELFLVRNQLLFLPPEIGQLTNLTRQFLSINRLSALPPEIGRLTNLTMLELIDNQLSALPPEIGRLTNLTMLDLADNQLSALPPEIGQIANLRRLHLGGNQLSALPPEIGRLTVLKELLLHDNQLSALPPEIGQLTALKELFLHDNPGLDLPTDVLGPLLGEVYGTQKATPARPADILAYYFRTREASRPLHEAKMILVGRGQVGKTCLVEQLVNGTFSDQEKTEGIKITPWATDLTDGTLIHLNIWDFGGQEIMHATHQFFLTERSVYVLALNGREGGEDYDADYWLKLITSFGGDSPVIVVLNKINQHPFDLNRKALREKYPNIVDFIRTDCKDRTGIDELHATILRTLDAMAGIRAKFPGAWFAIKNRIGRMKDEEKQGFMSLDRYRAICDELGEKDHKAQDELAGHLHCLGVALNYKDDPRLRDTSVLNPHWVTNGIYRLLNAKCLEEQHGVLSVNHLPGLLPEDEYPPEKHAFLLELMRKFKLCFAFPDANSGQYLVPELLSKEEPELDGQFLPKECLSFEYHYSILPEGLLPSFIVRSHVLSRNQPRWRSGVVLTWEGCKALVKADATERYVRILVRGPSPEGRRRLLAVIRSDLDRIRLEIKRLEVTAKVSVPGHPGLAIDYDELVGLAQAGEKEIKRFIDGKVVTINIADLLSGVDPAPLPAVARIEPSLPQDRARIFVSYSHKDESLREELDTHLKLFQHLGEIDLWNDRRIVGGEDWGKEIDDNLSSADVILLLISADFIASKYCWGIEAKRAMARHEAKEAQVIPVILRDCVWNKAPFAKLQAFPKDGKAVNRWPDRDTAWRNVAEGIQTVLEQLRPRNEPM